MRILFRSVLCAVLLIAATLAFSSLALGAEPYKVYLDSDEMVFDVEPFDENNRLYLPVRAISEAAGASVEWDDGSVIIYYGTDKHILTIGSNTMLSNDVEISLDAPPILKDGRTFMLWTFVDLWLDLSVEYVGNTMKLYTKAPDSDSGSEEEVPGFDEYKAPVAEMLAYDTSAIPFIKTKQVETGLLESDTMATVMFFEMYLRGERYAVLVIDIGGSNVYECPTEKMELFSCCAQFVLADIDGDGYDEIVVTYNTGGNGGAGSHEAIVYKLVDNKLQKMFSSPSYSSNHSEFFQTGFALTLSDGWTHTIDNKNTGFSRTFVRKVPTGNSYFDEHGNITDYAKEYNKDSSFDRTDPFFYIFKPVDIDGDGTFEIMTAQFTSLWGHADYVGNAYTILKWNSQREDMDVIKAGFWPYEEDNYSDESYRKHLQEYEENWYRDFIF